MWIVQKIIKKYESGSDWKYDLALLLGENPGSRRVNHHKVQLDDGSYKESGGMSILVEELKILEQQGFIEVKWYQKGSYATAFSYKLEDIPKFYAMEKRIPKPQLVKNYLKDVDNYLSKAQQLWIILALTHEREQALKGRVPEDKEKQEKYFQCLLGLDGLREPIFKRVFSKKYLNNSKTFEREVQNRVLSAARKYHEDIDEEMSDTQILSEILIEEYAQELELKGPLHLMLGGRELRLEEFCYGTVLNSETLKNACILEEQPIDCVITVENKANFVSMPYKEGTLILFSHGFFSPREREFLQRLEKVLRKQSVRYMHTGDLDYGGIRIFQYIRKNIFSELLPMSMDCETYETYRKYGETIEPETVKKLENLREPVLQALIDRMKEEQYTVEQEAFLVV